MKGSAATLAVIVGAAFWVAGVATAQTGNPPGDAIEHVGPLSPGGQPVKSPPAQKPVLTPAQKAAIFSSVTLDKSKIKPPDVLHVTVGAPVPPTIELYPLPEGVLAEAPAARPYKYTMVANEVVLIDPATMRVIDIIKP